MVHCGLEELNKALNFTVFGRRKIAGKIFNIETQLKPRPGPHLQIDQTIINIDIFFLLWLGCRRSVMFVVTHCGVTVYYETKVNSAKCSPTLPLLATQKIFAVLPEISI